MDLRTLLPERFVPARFRAGARVAPGPSRDLVGNWVALLRDPLAFLADNSARHRGAFRFRLGPTLIHVLADADSVKHVFQDPARFTKTFAYDKVRPVLGQGLLTSEGEHHRSQRRLLQPAFVAQRIAGYAEPMVRLTRELLDEWEDPCERGETIDVAREMMKLTLRIVSSTLYGLDIRDDTAGIGEAMAVLIEGANRRIMALTGLGQHLPTRGNQAFARARTFLDRLTYRMMAERRASRAHASDFLADLMGLRDDGGHAMSDPQLRDEMLTLLVAGHETTAGTLGWAFYLLSRHPAAWRKLRDEVTSVCEDRAPRHSDLPRLTFTRMVLEETLRMYPPGWVLVRTVQEAVTLEGYDIPRGSVVAVCPYLLHRDPRYWDNPEGFDPERFTDEASATRPRFAYFPWSGGPRACIGKAFAMMEMQLVVAAITQRFRLDLARDVVLSPQVTLRARDGIQVRLQRLATAGP